jgi:hypothetical protein
MHLPDRGASQEGQLFVPEPSCHAAPSFGQQLSRSALGQPSRHAALVPSIWHG